MFASMNVVALAGGVGGAKLADGLAQVLSPERLTIIVNTGDDFIHLGLNISPDLDTVCYTLAGMANPVTGWGRAGETWQAMESLAQLGGPTWFHLGDRDLGLHLERTRRLARGQPLSRITRDFCRAWGVRASVIPMSDDQISTFVDTDEGELAFQEYFVHRQCRPRVSGFRFEGIEAAQPAPGVLEALRRAQLVAICPSNPWVSVDPILAVPGIRKALAEGREAGRSKVLAVSPIIGGQTVKGPAAKMYAELGILPSALAVARHYRTFLDGFVLDHQDADLEQPVQSLGISPLVTNTLMVAASDRRRLAEEMLTFGAGRTEK
jgi:LPPG:FO 2-phospho-L-lactate transferase